MKTITKIWLDGQEDGAIELKYNLTDCEQAADLLGYNGDDYSILNFEYREVSRLYVIHNTSGQWWSGTCWTIAESNAQQYEWNEAPDELPMSNFDDDIKMRSWEDGDECFYYDESGSEDDDAVASLVEVD
jgi:hypothetical protein